VQTNLIKFFSIVNAAIRRNQIEFTTPFSIKVLTLLGILRQEGFIGWFTINEKTVTVRLIYKSGRPVLKQLSQVSTPTRPVFSTFFSLYFLVSKIRVRQKLLNFSSNLILIDTPKGLMTWQEIQRFAIGGKIICIAYS